MDLSGLTNRVTAGVNGFKSAFQTAPANQTTQANATPPAQAQAPSDQSSISWGNFSAGAAQPAPALNGPQSATLKNSVQMTKYYENGAQTSMQAVLPGMLGGGSLLPAPMLVQAHTNAQGMITDASAEFLDKSGKPLLGPDGQAHQIQGGRAPDGNIYFATDDKNPNAPLAVFAEDGTYGVTTRPEAAPNNPNVFLRDRMETIDPQGNRTMKFNEVIGGAPAQPQVPGLGGFGFGGMLGGFVGGGGIQQPGAVAHHYTEARVDAQGTVSASIVDETLLPGQKSPGAATTAQGILSHATPFGAFASGLAGGAHRVDSPLQAHMQNGALETSAPSVGNMVLNAFSGHGNLLQQRAAAQGQGPAEYRPLSTNELATADGAAAVYQTVAAELKNQPA